MDFASKYVLDNEEDEYECISEDEFLGGMELSDSSDSGEDIADGAEHVTEAEKPKRRVHHWRQTRNGDQDVSEASISKRWFRRADTNVVSVNFDTLMLPGSMHAGDPVICTSCNAIFSRISKPFTENDNLVWNCEFCGNAMVIDIMEEEFPTEEEVTYLMEPGKATTTSGLSGKDESLVVFCVDTSGSMCVTSEVEGRVQLRGNSHLRRLDSFSDGGSQFLPSQRHNVTYVSRLQAMQAAVDNQLSEMAKDFPHRRVALVCFSSDVTIIGDGFTEEVTVAGDKLSHIDELTQIGSQALQLQPIQKCRKKLGEKVYKLDEGGATALGPALVIATNIAASQPGSKVIVCTDGKANIGLGKLEDDVDNEVGTEFYTKVGEDAIKKGVTFSVITIKGTDCKLVHLGQLADKTGGQVNIVDPLNLTNEFGNILADQIIATNVKSKFFVHKALYILDETSPDSRQCMAEYSPGNVQASTSITFEFARRSTKNAKDSKETIPKEGEGEGKVDNNAVEEAHNINDDAEEGKLQDSAVHNSPVAPASSASPAVAAQNGDGAVAAASGSASKMEVTAETAETVSEFPFQLQIEYTDMDGLKALRVVTRSVPATADREMAESNANLDVLGAHAAKKTADLALQGEYSLSRGKALMQQRLAWRSSRSEHAPSDQRLRYRTIYTRIKEMENRVQRKQTFEISSRGATYSDDEMDDEYEESESSVPWNAACPMPVAAERQLKKKKCINRSVDMDDSFAKMAYNFRRVSPRDISSSSGYPASHYPNPTLPPQYELLEEVERFRNLNQLLLMVPRSPPNAGHMDENQEHVDENQEHVDENQEHVDENQEAMDQNEHAKDN